MSLLSTSRYDVQPTLPFSHTGSETSQHSDSAFGLYRVIDRLGISEFRRRLFHMSPALLPIGLPWIPHNDVWDPWLFAVSMVCGIVAIVVACVVQPIVSRIGECEWSHAVFGYIAPIAAGLLLFPGRAELGLMTLQIVALGDGSATLGGILLGGRVLPWNHHKTFSGLICFMIMGTLGATYFYWQEARPVVPLESVFLICLVATLVAAIVESVPISTNDNLRVGTTALIVGALMSALIL